MLEVTTIYQSKVKIYNFFSENSPKSDLKSFRLRTSLTNPFYNNLHKLCKCMYCEKSFENVDSNFHAVFVFYLLKFVSSVVVKFVVVVVISYNSMKRKTILLVFKFLTWRIMIHKKCIFQYRFRDYVCDNRYLYNI